MDYATLVSTIKAYTENAFPNTGGAGGLTTTQQIDTFIREAEQRIFNSVQLLDFRKEGTLTCVTGTPTVSTPGDWIANFSLALVNVDGSYSYLLNKDANFIQEAFPFPTSTGTPTHYAYSDQNTFLLGPTPDSTYSLKLTYFYYPTSIVDAGTSWLGDNFDSVLLYGSLLEAYTFMKGEADVMTAYQKRYDEALAMLKELGEGKNRQDMYRTPQVRYPVR